MFSPVELTRTQLDCFSNLSLRSLISFVVNLVYCTLVLITKLLFLLTLIDAFGNPTISSLKSLLTLSWFFNQPATSGEPCIVLPLVRVLYAPPPTCPPCLAEKCGMIGDWLGLGAIPGFFCIDLFWDDLDPIQNAMLFNYYNLSCSLYDYSSPDYYLFS